MLFFLACATVDTGCVAGTIGCVEDMKDTPSDTRVLAQAVVSADGAGPWTGTLDLLQKSTNLWDLTVGEGSITVDTPSGSDLGTLVGVEVTADVADGNLTLVGTDGVVHYVLSTQNTDPAPGAFGREVVERGDTFGTFYEMGWQVDFGAITFDGTAVGPGEVGEVSIDGQAYRATTIAQLQVSRYSDGASKCPPGDTLSYELIRVEAEVAPEERTREAGVEYARTGCG